MSFWARGSATTSEATSTVEATITPMRPDAGRSHATGRTQTRYQGSRTGASSVNSSNPHAQVAPWTSNHLPTASPLAEVPSHVRATRTVRTARSRKTTANVSANAHLIAKAA